MLKCITFTTVPLSFQLAPFYILFVSKKVVENTEVEAGEKQSLCAQKSAMEGGAQYNPRTVEEVLKDLKGRRAGLIKALTTGILSLFFSFLSLAHTPAFPYLPTACLSYFFHDTQNSSFSVFRVQFVLSLLEFSISIF